MITPRELADSPAWAALGWTVVHFLWQGIVIGLLAAALLRSSNASRGFSEPDSSQANQTNNTSQQ